MRKLFRNINEKQRDGIANVLDNLGAAAIVGSGAGFYTDTIPSTIDLIALTLTGPICLLTAFIIRR